MRTFVQLIKEFGAPLILALCWAFFRPGERPADTSLLRWYGESLGPAFFLFSWLFAQWFRVQKHIRDEDHKRRLMETMTGLARAGPSDTAMVLGFLPAAVTGYKSIVRVVNMGQCRSPVHVSHIDPITGMASPSVLLPGGPLEAQGAANYSALQIETALGNTLPANSRPTLRFTCIPQTQIRVHHYVVNPDGTLVVLP